MNKKMIWKTIALSWYWTIMAILGMCVVLTIVLLMLERFIPSGVLVSGIIGLATMSLISFAFSEVIINFLFDAEIAKQEEYPIFVEVSNELFKKKRLLIYPRLYIINLPMPNAMAYGMGFPGFSAIAITSELYNLLSKPELKAVIAHEMAHIISKDIGIITTIGVLIGSVEKLRELFLNGKTVLGKGPFAFLFAGILWVVSKVIFGFLKAAISQEREISADARGASYVENPQDLINALKKLSECSDQQPRNVFYDLMVSHPGIEERINSLKNLTKGK